MLNHHRYATVIKAFRCLYLSSICFVTLCQYNYKHVIESFTQFAWFKEFKGLDDSSLIIWGEDEVRGETVDLFLAKVESRDEADLLWKFDRATVSLDFYWGLGCEFCGTIFLNQNKLLDREQASGEDECLGKFLAIHAWSSPVNCVFLFLVKQIKSREWTILTCLRSPELIWFKFAWINSKE